MLHAPPIPWELERLKPFIRSMRLSPSRRSADMLSTGFTGTTSICVEVVAVGALVVPTVAGSCACAANEHAATPPNRLMNLWHLIAAPGIDLVVYPHRRSKSRREECHKAPGRVTRELQRRPTRAHHVTVRSLIAVSLDGLTETASVSPLRSRSCQLRPQFILILVARRSGEKSCIGL
jgi:hypothetical protein